MKKYLSKYILLFIACVFLALAVFLFIEKSRNDSEGRRLTLMNRLADQLASDIENVGSRLDEALKDNDWEKTYGKENLPVSVVYKELEMSDRYALLAGADNIWALSEDGKVKGLLIFEFEDDSDKKMLIVSEGVILICFLVTTGFFVYIDRKLLMPFNKLSDYPERIARNEKTALLPEMKNRYFGRYVWGMNMLRDRLSGDNRKLRELEKEQLTLVSTIAHGIKTPVANIKLYSDALKKGIYKDNSEVADKITKNADDITDLLKELLNSASKGVVAYEPEIDSFYLSEIADFIKEEYDNRLSVSRIAYSIDLKSRVMIDSDKDGIQRIITQLMENAIKYGDGRGIRIIIDKNEDGYIFSVSDKGSRIPETEMPYLFNSFWRGSNAASVEGNGLGLYEAAFIARKLGGDILVRYIEETEETEFELFLPL